MEEVTPSERKPGQRDCGASRSCSEEKATEGGGLEGGSLGREGFKERTAEGSSRSKRSFSVSGGTEEGPGLTGDLQETDPPAGAAAGR